MKTPAFVSFFCLLALIGQAQPPPPIAVEAIMGEPYGVARLMFPAGQVESTESLRILVNDDEDRIIFPAFDLLTSEPPQVITPRSGERPRLGSGALLNRIRTALENAREQIDPPEIIRVQFLFRGSEPFFIRLSGDIQGTIEISPVAQSTTSSNDTSGQSLVPKGLSGNSTQYQSLFKSWWDGYVKQAKRQIERSDYPAIVENYLTHMLAYRYGFPLPELAKSVKGPKKKQQDPLPTLALVAGVEKLRGTIHEETLRQSPPENLRIVPVPAAPKWVDVPAPDTPNELPIESISKLVPPECYYLRFSAFADYLWFQQLSANRGGDLAQMAILRGFNYETNSRMERVLSTKMNLLVKLFGDSIVNEMAIVGHDLYLQEGPALGVVLQAKNIALLKTALTQDRAANIKQLASIGGKMETLEIEGVPVSFLSTPDNQVRSFMVDQGQYVFLTTSKQLMKRFLQVSKGAPSLGDTRAFRFARMMMPLENNYDVFIYLSSDFFRNLVSPQYQIELRRRLKAIAAIEIAEMASLTAAAETGIRTTNPSIEKLIADGYLPSAFQTRVDGSHTLAYQGSWHDSLRGRRGSFLPISDVEVADCTVEEAEAYREQAEFYANQWQQTDPLMVGIRRFDRGTNDGVERLALEAYVAPLGREKYGFLANLLAPPVSTQIQLPPDDVINCQVHMAGQSLPNYVAPDHVMFAGLKDMVPPLPGETKGLLATLRTLQSLPAYVGGWPRPGYLDQLPLGLGGGQPDAMGFSRLLVGAWRWQAGGFSVLSFDRSILENCMSYLKPIPAEDFAQGRLMVGDLDKSQLSAWFNTYWFRRAAQTTRGNLTLLDSLQVQLKVPAPEALEVAEKILDARLQCSLGGSYVIAPEDQTKNAAMWTSTAWPTRFSMTDDSLKGPRAHLGFDSTKCLPTPGYKAPWLEWFRGANLHLTQLPERLIVVGTLDIESIAVGKADGGNGKGNGEALPKMNLDLFNMPFQFFQGDKPKVDPSASKGNIKKASETRKSF